MTAVSLKGVTKQFHAGVIALDGIDLDVEPGEFVSLIGPSGCGKSTLLRVIGDLTKPTARSTASTRNARGATTNTASSSRTPFSTTGERWRRTSRCHSSYCAGAEAAGTPGSRT